MCGILGLVSNKPVGDRSWITTGRATMAHRGPDDAGEYWSSDGRVGFGHLRLAIVDLSPTGHQPMSRPEFGLTIVFNGEIYNFQDLRRELEGKGYQFRSSSDTEVLLAAYDAWGSDFLARLNGMFAFALHDYRRNIVLFARDRAGEKPFFYRLAGGTLQFASELKALMAVPGAERRINKQAMDTFLARGFVPGDGCILEGCHKLPPAHAMQFDLTTGEANVWRYWAEPALAPQAESEALDEGALLDELEALLEDSVGRQMVADVPVGVLLSGGVDSSLITALAVRNSSRVKTFTISFPGHGALDEAEHARLIASHFNTDHRELVAEPTLVDLLPMLARQFDEPIIDSSMIPTYLVSHMVRQHCTVAIGGDGGDELFGGYGHYSRLLWMQKRLGRIPRPIRQAISASAGALMPVGMKGRNWAQGLGADLDDNVPLLAYYFDAPTRRRLMGCTADWPLVGESSRSALSGTGDMVQRATRMDFRQYLPEDILVKVDRASMLNSLEIRAPFLDHRLIEFAFGRVPSRLKATRDDKKIMLKRLAERILPPQFDRARKQGFSIPMNDWLRAGPFREFFRETLLGSDTLFDRKVVAGLFDGQDKGRSNGERLFALVLFELWRREYDVTL